MSKGITSVEAHKLQKEYGRNVIENTRRISWVKKCIAQISSFLIILLLIAAILSFAIGEILDGSLILIIILINAGFGMFQEFKADQAVAALNQLSVSSIRVIRDGKEQEIDSKQLVPGDLIIVEEGVKVPADAKIIEAHHLEMNEASLTGESFAVVKSKDDILYMGTIVAKGRAQAIVTQIGMKTKFGLIAAELSTVEHSLTPLQKKLAHLTEIVGLAGIIISLFVFVLSALQGHGTFPSFLLAISLAVAVVPESLPAVMTVILSIGVKHMAKRNAVIRKLAAIEALGNTTLIATDKTGTLTENKMDVKKVWFNGAEHEVSDLIRSDHLGHAALSQMIYDGILCSTASLVEVHDHGRAFDVLGDPTEGALLMLAKKLGIEVDFVRKEFAVLDEQSFDAVTKRMTVVVEKEHVTYTYSKGAPHAILEISSHILSGKTESVFTTQMKEDVHTLSNEWAKAGFRVMAMSYTKGKSDIHKQRNQVFLGLVAIHDPLRPEAKDAIRRAHNAGITVVMITGDNENTAEAIGTAAGLIKVGDTILKGEQIDAYSDEELMRLLPNTRIFARTTPFHKSRIVSLYQKLGEIVTVTGDGVNDAVALKQANVGVAMGKVGTDVAREVADMVILDDNFATIVSAVEEGRNIVVRLKNSIKYLLTGNLSEGLALVIGLLLGFPPLLLPIQLLYINLISDGVPALAMAFTPKNAHAMQQKPDRAMVILKRKDIGYVTLIGFTVATIVIITYKLLAGKTGIFGGDPQTAAFTVLAIIQAFIFMDIWFSHRAEHVLRTLVPPIFVFTVAAPITIQFMIVRSSFLSQIFRVQILQIGEFGVYLLASGSILGILWIGRLILKRD